MPRNATPAPQATKQAASSKKEFRAQTTVDGLTYAALQYRAEQAVPPASYAAMVRYVLADFAKRNPAPAYYTPPTQEA